VRGVSQREHDAGDDSRRPPRSHRPVSARSRRAA
jgi:hypothetical protein